VENPYRVPAATDLTIDVVTGCDCCTFNGLTIEAFLESFHEHVPKPGVATMLRLHGADEAGVGFLLHTCGNAH